MTTEDGLPLSGPRGLWEEGEGMRAELRVCTGVAVGSCFDVCFMSAFCVKFVFFSA